MRQMGLLLTCMVTLGFNKGRGRFLNLSDAPPSASVLAIRETAGVYLGFCHRVATKISRNEIPRYFVLFLFRIFAKILGKFRGISRNFFSRKCSYFRHISRNSVDLVQRKLVPVWGQESRWCLSPLPELTEVLLGGIGEGGVCGLA